MRHRSLAGRIVAGIAMTALILGLAALTAPPSAAQPGSDPLTGVHLLNVDLYACAYDDGDGLEFKPPLVCAPSGSNLNSAPPDYTNQTLVDLLALGTVRGELRHDTGARLPWWRGPFHDANGDGALPEDGDVRLCFKDQRATWGYFGGTNNFGVTTRIGLFRGAINFGCDPGDLLGEADVTVYAPPSGLRVCGEVVNLEDDGDWVEAMLCLRNDRIDPQPAARTIGASRGLAPLSVEFDASPSVVPVGVRSYSWNFGDTVTSAQGPRIVHRYDDPGSYPVTLTITDLAGRTRTRTVLTIDALALPVARFSGPVTASAGAATSFDGSRSADGNGTGGRIQWYRWDFGDGSPVVKLRRPASGSTHQYANRGKYLVTLTVITDDGRTGSTTAPITVT